MWFNTFFFSFIQFGLCFEDIVIKFSIDYFIYRDVKFVCLINCDDHNIWSSKFVKKASEESIAISKVNINVHDLNFEAVNKCWRQKYNDIGVLIEGKCDKFDEVMEYASQSMMFNGMHKWLIIINNNKPAIEDFNETIANETFVQFNENVTDVLKVMANQNISVDADIILGLQRENLDFDLYEAFNFGKIQGGDLNVDTVGSWNEQSGLTLQTDLNAFKYYRRWDFQQLALRMIVVMSKSPTHFDPEMIIGRQNRPDVAFITKASTIILNAVALIHNFRYKYTIGDKWVGVLSNDSPKVVVSSLYFRHQDISPVIRFMAELFENFDIVHPPLAYIEIMNMSILISIRSRTSLAKSAIQQGLYGGQAKKTSFVYGGKRVKIILTTSNFTKSPKFLHVKIVTDDRRTRYYYRIPTKGPGKFENQFLRPLTTGAWICVVTVITLCAFILLLTAILEHRPMPGQYAVFSVVASFCQQFFEDSGDRNTRRTSIARRITVLVTGISCLLIYNFYTSSVVSWLLNGPPPSINSLEELLESPLDLIYEDIGYTRSWLQFPSYYYNKRNAKVEDAMRHKKVFNKKKDAPLLVTVEEGIEMVKAGGYAYHTEVNSANMMISRKFTQTELCELGSLQSMEMALLYPAVQKNSPFKEFFVWSLSRLRERGIVSCIQRRTSSNSVSCEGSSPRALALGGAAPAFLMLAFGYIVATIILFFERFIHKHFGN